jgi:hypothetical protein
MRYFRSVTAALAVISCVETAAAAEMTEPGGTAQATQMALFNPDEYAWRLFFFVNQQAAKGMAGLPDASKPSFREYDADTDVVWESWALASGEESNLSEVFRRPATRPVAWDDLRKTPSPKVLSSLTIKDSPLLHVRGINIDVFKEIVGSQVGPLFVPFPGEARRDETRMNRVVFETVRDRELYSVEGIARRYGEAIAQIKAKGIDLNLAGPNLLVAFGQGAKEVKARWKQLASEQDKARYHWRNLTITRPDGTVTTQAWGLVALHIITRDTPNWFWSDFGHIDMERDAWCVRPNNPAPETCPRDTTTRGPNAPSGKDGVRTETKGTKWENYILRGTQTDFVDAIGRRTILSNPVIEINDQKSSCISCHARAAVRPDGIGGVEFFGMGAPGVPNPNEFLGSPPEAIYLQMDFLWSIPFRAGSENPAARPTARLR